MGNSMDVVVPVLRVECVSCKCLTFFWLRYLEIAPLISREPRNSDRQSWYTWSTFLNLFWLGLFDSELTALALRF
jgi:hypothetical protein